MRKRRRTAMSGLFGLVLLVTFSAAAQTWRQVGPPGGDVQSLAAVPGGTRTLFLAPPMAMYSVRVTQGNTGIARPDPGAKS